MSIASEIQDLQTNLQAAKSAVTTKGGTVADTGLAGLASEIASIPSGGGPLASYGTVTYLDNGVEKTVTMVNECDFYELTVGGSGTPIRINGIDLIKNDIKGLTVADGVQYLPDNFCSGCNYLETVTLPDTIHYIGLYAFGFAKINSQINLTNVKSIGGSFLQGNSSFNQPLSMPNIEYIGSNFLSDCSQFNSSITLNNGLRVIGSNFMNGCRNFAQSLTIPAGLEDLGTTKNPDTSFMRNCNAFTGPLVCNGPVTSSSNPTDNNSLSTTSSTATMYTTGITLTGPYAEQWKNALSDRASSPYRKLIVGS